MAGSLSAAVGTQEPIYGPEAIHSVAKQAGETSYTELSKDQLRWKAFQYTNVETKTFYIMADVSPSGLGSREFAFRLLREREVAVAPGTAFGEAARSMMLERDFERLLYAWCRHGSGRRRLAHALDLYEAGHVRARESIRAEPPHETDAYVVTHLHRYVRIGPRLPPHLAIVDQSLWKTVKACQQATREEIFESRAENPEAPGIERGRRPRHLLSDLIRWELTLLADLGYGLDLSACAVTGESTGLAYVSPRTGRAVTAAGAGEWTERLLPLPGFLTGQASPDAAGWRDGLRLTGHFLARDAFGHHHRPLPQARVMLYDRVSALADLAQADAAAASATNKDMKIDHAG